MLWPASSCCAPSSQAARRQCRAAEDKPYPGRQTAGRAAAQGWGPVCGTIPAIAKPQSPAPRRSGPRARPSGRLRRPGNSNQSRLSDMRECPYENKDASVVPLGDDASDSVELLHLRNAERDSQSGIRRQGCSAEDSLSSLFSRFSRRFLGSGTGLGSGAGSVSTLRSSPGWSSIPEQWQTMQQSIEPALIGRLCLQPD